MEVPGVRDGRQTTELSRPSLDDAPVVMDWAEGALGHPRRIAAGHQAAEEGVRSNFPPVDVGYPPDRHVPKLAVSHGYVRVLGYRGEASRPGRGSVVHVGALGSISASGFLGQLANAFEASCHCGSPPAQCGAKPMWHWVGALLDTPATLNASSALHLTVPRHAWFAMLTPGWGARLSWVASLPEEWSGHASPGG